LNRSDPPTIRERDPRTQVGLASWLGGGSVFIVLLAVFSMAIACAVLLHRLVESQALVRAQLAVASARELLRRVGEDALSDARVLAERPTLQRLIGDGSSGLEPFLQRFTQTTGSDVVALMRDGSIIAESSATVDWSEVSTAIQEQGERFLISPKSGGPLIWGAAAAVPSGDVRAVALRLASPELLGRLGNQVGAQLRVVNFTTYHAPPDDPLTAVHTRALADTSRAADGILDRGRVYAASLVLAAQTGEVVGLLDAELSGAETIAELRSFNWVLASTAIIVAIIAGIGGLFYGRWLARPVVALRDLAERIGRGDFSAAMPAVAPLEVGALAQAMNAMRENLISLTEALRRREAEAQTVLNGVVEGVFAVDSERHIRYANGQVARLLGRPQSEIIGRFCGDVLQPQPVDGERPCERRCPIVLARTEAQSARETLSVRDGSKRSTIIQSAPPIHGVQVQILRDETDLEAARRARDGVLGNISHEFRTPLAAQLASIELLRDGLEGMAPEAQRELLAGLERGGSRLMRLVDNLLESVRIEAGKLSIRQQPVDLSEVIADANDLMAPLLAQRQLRLAVDVESVSAVVSGDAQRLAQVFVNLLANAVKFSPEGSTIYIGGRRLDSQIEVWVEDEGLGVPSGSSLTIFERFQRGTEAEPDAPGLGLGLWIVKSIIDRHGGSVRVERTAAQRTRFSLLLPLDKEIDP
jgi:signal transduction histidine kinase